MVAVRFRKLTHHLSVSMSKCAAAVVPRIVAATERKIAIARPVAPSRYTKTAIPNDNKMGTCTRYTGNEYCPRARPKGPSHGRRRKGQDVDAKMRRAADNPLTYVGLAADIHAYMPTGFKKPRPNTEIAHMPVAASIGISIGAIERSHASVNPSQNIARYGSILGSIRALQVKMAT